MSNFTKFLTALKVVLAAAFFMSAPLAYASEDCDDPSDFLDVDIDYPKQNSGKPVVAEVKNESKSCTVKIGLASYMEHDSSIDHQTLFSYDADRMIAPGQTLTLQ